ncbi:hypothetical protein ACLOJK_017510 [Asimina triloba]
MVREKYFLRRNPIPFHTTDAINIDVSCGCFRSAALTSLSLSLSSSSRCHSDGDIDLAHRRTQLLHNCESQPFSAGSALLSLSSSSRSITDEGGACRGLELQGSDLTIMEELVGGGYGSDDRRGGGREAGGEIEFEGERIRVGDGLGGGQDEVHRACGSVEEEGCEKEIQTLEIFSPTLSFSVPVPSSFRNFQNPTLAL